MKTTHLLLCDAVNLFNKSHYWEAHEVFESLWKQSSGAAHQYFQGLIFLCAAMVHRQRGNGEVAKNLIGKACKNLEHCPEKFQRVRLQHLVAQLKKNPRVSSKISIVMEEGV